MHWFTKMEHSLRTALTLFIRNFFVLSVFNAAARKTEYGTERLDGIEYVTNCKNIEDYVVAYLRRCPSTCLEAMNKSTDLCLGRISSKHCPNISQNS